ncbi:superoxide reductase [Caldicoprobacter guelmensis]|uniref:desulfoferrodoxin n=1 Tax=Caldicoprobacter guelmensis TaxID=1170224 RepID=UPI00195810B0|nr:desulfoferrodoxin [Caldicoprobacter guelmensis]MBM7582813.1 superoxide reductase [Caldicoprobacter guelmensis]
MRNQVAFYRCEICGNMVELIKRGGGELVCCGQPMTELKANTVDASIEKHVPSVTRKDGKLHIQVGSVLHPMVPEHYIEWIAVVSDASMQRIVLQPGQEPKAEVVDSGGEIDVYGYCNLHGLWKTEVR